MGTICSRRVWSKWPSRDAQFLSPNLFKWPERGREIKMFRPWGAHCLVTKLDVPSKGTSTSMTICHQVVRNFGQISKNSFAQTSLTSEISFRGNKQLSGQQRTPILCRNCPDQKPVSHETEGQSKLCAEGVQCCIYEWSPSSDVVV